MNINWCFSFFNRIFGFVNIRGWITYSVMIRFVLINIACMFFLNFNNKSIFVIVAVNVLMMLTTHRFIGCFNTLLYSFFFIKSKIILKTTSIENNVFILMNSFIISYVFHLGIIISTNHKSFILKGEIVKFIRLNHIFKVLFFVKLIVMILLLIILFASIIIKVFGFVNRVNMSLIFIFKYRHIGSKNISILDIFTAFEIIIGLNLLFVFYFSLFNCIFSICFKITI